MKALYKKTYSHLHASEETYLEVMNMTGKHKKTRNPLRTILIAAAITALLVTTVYAASNALIALRIEKKAGAEKSYAEVHFDRTEDVYLELGSVYPQSVPEGYACTFVSDSVYGRQVVRYGNAEGTEIVYTIRLGSSGESLDVLEIEQEEAVDINGLSGVLYTQKDGVRTLVWVNEAQGFGFSLWADDPQADLVVIAKSVTAGEKLTPTRADSTTKALEELGDFVPGLLPDDYEEESVLGSPLEEGGGWYSYVRKFYVNKAQNTRIYFEYETYAIDTESGYVDNAETICSFYIPGCDVLNGIIVGQRTEIDGMFALVSGTDIAWADTERHMVFHLYSEDITSEELLEVANSIQRADS